VYFVQLVYGCHTITKVVGVFVCVFRAPLRWCPTAKTAKKRYLYGRRCPPTTRVVNGYKLNFSVVNTNSDDADVQLL
jgi:hypothetical protein